jgi:hypothetical protein
MIPNKKGENINQPDELIDNYEMNYIDPSTVEYIEEEESPLYNNWNESTKEFYPKRKEDEVIIGTIKVPS